MTSTFVVTAGKPGIVDLTSVYKDLDVTLHTKAIYSIEGDVLTYCIGAPDQPRPTAFATEKGDGQTLVVLKRADSKQP